MACKRERERERDMPKGKHFIGILLFRDTRSMPRGKHTIGSGFITYINGTQEASSMGWRLESQRNTFLQFIRTGHLSR
jgi:hypothetical protein